MLKNKFFVILMNNLIFFASGDVCISSGCRKASTDVLSFIDPAIDPCQDFYKFACSGIFKKTHEGKPVSLKAIVSRDVENQISSMLKKPSHATEPKAVQALNSFFRLCMNESVIEKNGAHSLKQKLNKLGGWPAVDGPKWNENDFNVEEMLIKLRKLGLEFKQLFYFGTTVDDKNPSLVLTEPYLPYIDDKDIESYYEYMLGVATSLGAVKEVASSDLEKTLQFRLKFRRVLDNADQCRMSSIHSMQEEFPLFNWLHLINNIVHPNKNITAYEKIYFPSRKYLNNLINLLHDTPNRTLANFIIWQAVEDVISYLPKQFRDMRNEYESNEENGNPKKYKSRYEFCRNETETILPPAFQAYYIQYHFSSPKRQKALELVSSVKEEFIKLIETTKLYDDDTRSKMLEKLDAITYYTGAPDKLFDDSIFAEVFDKNENVSTHNFLELTTIIKRQAANLGVKIRNVKDYYNIFYEATTHVDAFYELFSNTLELPSAIFQGLYFAENRPQYMNFGTLGTLMGSELIHGFTEDGSNFFEDLWTNKTRQNYDLDTECIINEANAFMIDDSSYPMNGSQILEETVCDYTGVEIAYRGYQNWINKYGEEKILPGLDYNPNQLFWISVASSFCDTVSLDDLQDFILRGNVGHPTYRLIGSISNNRNFGKDFDCSIGTRMNPSMKCIVF